MSGHPAPPWTLGYATLIFLMWAIMMVAMMLPSAAPTILLVTALARERIAPVAVAVPFACGYVLVWTGFSLAETALQFGLDRAGALPRQGKPCRHVGVNALDMIDHEVP
jgi:predicted metal-binding membrane protein